MLIPNHHHYRMRDEKQSSDSLRAQPVASALPKVEGGHGVSLDCELLTWSRSRLRELVSFGLLCATSCLVSRRRERQHVPRCMWTLVDGGDMFDRRGKAMVNCHGLANPQRPHISFRLILLESFLPSSSVCLPTSASALGCESQTEGH